MLIFRILFHDNRTLPIRCPSHVHEIRVRSRLFDDPILVYQACFFSYSVKFKGLHVLFLRSNLSSREHNLLNKLSHEHVHIIHVIVVVMNGSYFFEFTSTHHILKSSRFIGCVVISIYICSYVSFKSPHFYCLRPVQIWYFILTSLFV